MPKSNRLVAERESLLPPPSAPPSSSSSSSYGANVHANARGGRGGKHKRSACKKTLIVCCTLVFLALVAAVAVVLVNVFGDASSYNPFSPKPSDAGPPDPPSGKYLSDL